MGISDREYYRDESGGGGFFSGVAPACKTIIILNVVVFFYFVTAPNSSLYRLLALNSDAVLKHFEVWRLLTAPFLHARGPMHVLFNMLFLWWMGREVESAYGSREFARFYLTAALVSSVFWVAIDRLTPDAGEGYSLGASGAVMAVVTVYTLMDPKREVLLFLVLPVEMWVMWALYFGSDTLMMMQQIEGTGRGAHAAVAFASHVGGALYGFLYKAYDLRWGYLIGRRRRPRLRIVSPPPSRDRERERTSPLPTTARSASAQAASKGAAGPVVSQEQLDARLDEVLAKIAREGGRSGLTEEEHMILQEASRRARDRRSDRL